MDTAPAAPVAEAPTPAAAPADTPAPAGAETAAEPAQPERTFTQSELDEILKKKDAKRLRERDELRKERDILRKLALEGREPRREEPAPQQPAAKGEPARDQFGTYEEFIEAKAEWKASQRVDSKMKERDTADRERQAQEEAKRAGEDFRKRAKESAKDIKDFEEVMSNITADDPVARINAEAVGQTDAPGKVLYHLATHPDEAERIASLPMGQQAREVWKLEQKLSAGTPQKPSKAPEPIKPVAGKSTMADEMPDPNKDQKAWVAWRQKQIAAARGGGKRA